MRAIPTLLAALLLSPTALALTGREIMEKADKANRPKDETLERTMEIMNERGEVRSRKMKTFFKAGEGDDDMVLVRILEPAEVRGVGLLTLERGSSDDQWLYMPTLKKTKRLAGSSKADAFMGSNFANVDMRTEDLQGHDYQLLEEVEEAGRKAYKVGAMPKTDAVKEQTGYSKRILYVDAERWTTLRVDYFDLAGKELKVLKASDFKQVEGLWRADKVEIRSSQDKSRTRLLPPKRELNTGLSADIFSTRELERG